MVHILFCISWAEINTVDNSINLTFLGDEKREEEDTWDVTYLMKNYM